MDITRWRSTSTLALSVITLGGILMANTPGTATAAPSGPDVSSWQHVDGRFIDWFAGRRAGHDFAMVKATEGLNYVNPFFLQDSVLMRTAGIARGTYHYSWPSMPPRPHCDL